MALPTPPDAPPVPSRTQDKATFNTNIAAFLAFVVIFINFIKAWNTAMPAEVDQRIADAVAAYDPAGAYSADQVDALLAAQEKRSEDTAYFLAVTS